MGVALSTTYSFTTPDGAWSVPGMPLTTPPAGARYVCGQSMRQTSAVYNQVNGAVAVEFVGFVETDTLVTIPTVSAMFGFANAVFTPVYPDGVRAAIVATQDTTRMFSTNGVTNWKSIGYLR